MSRSPVPRGVTDSVIEALRQQVVPQFAREDEQLVYSLGKSLYETRRIDEDLYATAIQTFGEPGLVELVGVFGYYSLVAMTLNVFAVRRDSDAPLPFVER
ncbi:hypothetical protein ACCD10_08070 [Pseudomonas sp. Pseusp122]|uniref:hypothetical protein n=1 Tax=unclassified Pseudomonas TaxID=196821 RepID=UPI0039A6FC0F